MHWSPLNFGRYRDKTLPQILFSDPDWFFWACEHDVFQSHPEYYRQASVLKAKATSIKIPQAGPEAQEVEYTFAPEGCVGFSLVSSSRAWHHIDMSVPHRHANYDKLGGKLFLRSLKGYLFRNSRRRMTRARCEAFFNDDNNFLLNDASEVALDYER
jgi:hypothetical protein